MFGTIRSPASRVVPRAGQSPARSQGYHRPRRRFTVEALEERALLSTFTVNDLGDTGTGSGLSGDLRYAITQADQTTGDNTINFSVTGTIWLNSVLPDLNNKTGKMDIEGPGADNLAVARSSDPGTPNFRIFTIDSGADVKLVGLRSMGGLADVGNGGGILNSGTLTVDSSVFDNNSVRGDGGTVNSGTLTISNSTVANNSAVANGGPTDSGYGDVHGGGIYNVGTLTVANSLIASNSATSYAFGSIYGGGIYNGGTLNLNQCTLVGNVALGQRDGPYGPGPNAYGGAVYTTGDLTLNDCTVSNNSAQGAPGYFAPSYQGQGYAAGNASGGGLDVEGGTLLINSSRIVGNSALGGNWGAPGFPRGDCGGNAFGGGLTLKSQGWISQTLLASNSALGGNGASSPGFEYKGAVIGLGGDGGSATGGGLYFGGVSLSLIDSSIVQNQAIGGAGGDGAEGYYNTFYGPPPPYPWINPFVGNGGSGSGGGLAGGGDLVNDTFYGNSVSGGAGGSGGYTYWAYDPQGNVYFITDPYVGSTGSGTGGGLSSYGTVANTIVVQNTNGTGGGATTSDIDGSVSGGYNLIGTGGSGGLINGDNGNQVGVANPGLDPNGLQNNGGPTQTIALLSGSAAIDAGSNALAVDPTTGLPLTTDQRGFSRVVGNRVDIGAYEVQSLVSTVAVEWRLRSATLQTESDGLRLLPAGRNTDMPWLGIQQVPINLTQPATLVAGDVTVTSASGTNYGPVTLSGSGTSYKITLAQPINTADRVTITIGNDLIASFTRRLDVLPGDVNDDGVVNASDAVVERNQIIGYAGALPPIFGDINGDGVVDLTDFGLVRKRLGTKLAAIN